MEAARPALETQAEAGEAPAVGAIAALGGEASKNFLTGLADAAAQDSAGTGPLNDRLAGVLAALVSVDAPGTAGRVAEFLAGPADLPGAAAVFEAYLSRKDGPALLAPALQGKTLRPEVAKAGVQKASARGGDAKALVDVLTVAGGLQAVGMGISADEMSRMMAEVRENGDAVRGEIIYRKQEMLCQSCHAIGAVGGIVGPDLLSIGASAPVDYIIDSLLEPSKKIKEGYATTVVNTKSGGVFSGFLVREDAREVLLRDALGATQSIPAADVSGKQSMPVSLMPPSLTAGLRRDEFVDLVRFMSELGKEGNYKVQSDGVIRRWRLPQPAPDFWQVVNREGLRALTTDQPGMAWVPAYSMVNGELPVADIPVLKLYQTTGRVAQGEIEVTTPGPMVLKFADSRGLRAWVGDKEITPAGLVPLELPVGKHRITMVLEEGRGAPLRVEVEAAPGSNARVVPIGGV